ncbi:hypothetical protein [Desulfonatronovibrio magnus]|uniref:hypothetical protein n=1 Tax=Desulfonatronovibrio magnus TaxID=698827 RepID=UPI0005EB5EA6|nr:hypothetical protein [Desulfonatronovibrio magnus]RQD68113.1 MAG: hypothetical protein D5R98_00270 [Desulfonatronovibrio sp. MSAO_Bac4]
MDDWVIVATFDEMSEAVNKEKERIEDMAVDVGLMPEQVVKIQDKDNKVFIVIHPEFYSYYEG